MSLSADGAVREVPERHPEGTERPPCALPVRVVHVTSHHHPTDPRVFHECRSLAAAGFRVLLVAPTHAGEQRDGVEIVPVPPYRHRPERFLRTARLAVRAALARDPAILHFHDPELFIWAPWLALRGRRVVIDIHEDFVTAAYDRPWIPRPLRPAVAATVRLLMRLVTRRLPTVIAERYYASFAPGAIEVLNYARIDPDDPLFSLDRIFPDHPRLLYTGSITGGRGAWNHLALLDHLPADAALAMVGRCPDPALLTVLENRAREDPRLRLETSAGWIPWDRILPYYREPLTAGLAVFPDTRHYREKELTKFFEYMAAGLPIICSDFPAWRALVEGNRVGFCVDPEDPKAAAEAARRLVENPEEARAMGERGRRLVRERFNWASQAGNLVAFYRRLLDDPAAGAGVAAQAQSSR